VRASVFVNCESCGAPGCDATDRCGCGKIICPRCSDDDRLTHIKGGLHTLLKNLKPGVFGAEALGLATLELAVRTAQFQREKFPHQPVVAKIHHLIREANELLNAPTDIVENADVLILALGINAVNGRTIEELIAAALEKLTICEKRKWGEADEQGFHHHIEEK
jgi:Protein of unknown function (DUF550)